MDDFEICKDMPNEDRADIFKNFSGMAATQGQIRIMPAQNNKIKSFTKQLKDHFKLGIETTTIPFPLADTAGLLIRAKTYQLFMSYSDTISKDSKPVRLAKQVKW